MTSIEHILNFNPRGARYRLGLAFALWSGMCFAAAQSYDIDRFVISGGAGTSTGGSYSLTGTTGQANTGVMSGGSYSLTVGFWSLVGAVQRPSAPLLIVRLTGTNTVVVSWSSVSPGFVLQSSATVSPPNWTDVAQTPINSGTAESLVIPVPAGTMFYRLRNP
jgi:hypothetical protein